MNETNRVASRFPASSKGRGLCGWLMKRGGRVQTWKKRWFVVVGDQLFYYRTPSDPRAREAGFIPLPGNQVVRHPFDPRHPDKHMFEIVAGDRRLQVRNHESFMLSAESVEELETWISAINRIIREPLGGGMFGREVGRTVKQEARRSGGGYVPLVVQTTVSFLRQKGLDELGIFRLPGNQVKVQGLKELFDKGEHPDLQSCDEVHSVASLLKLYLRELPEPLIPFEYFDMFISAACVLEKDEAEGLQQWHLLLPLG
ncbi:rho GTPase-activating protein 24-like [Corticium candelabrum]|uniref:rho GTPase-activating protein 24-like n=1 Tax=Corticium candelabrum TaxID=121492 RepID=UPI002E25609D|nr:rho GTPase-activating protein 24-like [Corticium candelabrum]